MKKILWSLGLLAYFLATAILSYTALANEHKLQVISTALGGWWIFQCGILSLWVGLLAVSSWQMTSRQHKSAGRILAVMAVLAAILSIVISVAVQHVY